jgi:hypothetical protein
LWQGGQVFTGGLESDQVQAPIGDAVLEAVAATLLDRGLAVVAGRWRDDAAAWDRALQIAAAARDLDPLPAGLPGFEVVGEFTVPPPGVVQRDFQALHVDYGVPKLAGPPVPVARFTALYLDCKVRGSGAATRIVPLRRLLAQRSWPAPDVLVSRVCDDPTAGAPVEGILARIIEAADQSRDLPDREADGFLCGMEFLTLEEEQRYFAQHGLRLDAVEEEVVLTGGQLLLFDNLAIGHGRRGRRNAGELHQLCIGFGSLDLAGQAALLNRFLSGFEHGPGHRDAAAATSDS